MGNLTNTTLIPIVTVTTMSITMATINRMRITLAFLRLWPRKTTCLLANICGWCDLICLEMKASHTDLLHASVFSDDVVSVDV